MDNRYYSIDTNANEITPGRIEFNIDRGLPYGDMPASMLTDKFEATEIDDDDPQEIVHRMQRNTLIDRRPDPRTLESDQVQKNTDSRAFLNHRYKGTRGGEEVQHPELFLPHTERDTRGYRTDPDFRKIKKQLFGRIEKYTRFNKENNNFTTGGHRSERQILKDNKKLFTQTKNRLKIFSTSKDGRGAKRGIEYGDSTKQKRQALAEINKYSDLIRADALVRQRHTVKLSNKILDHSKFYHNNTSDHEFKVGKYGQDPKGLVQEITENKITNCTRDGKHITPSDMNKCYKSIGMLLGDVVKRSEVFSDVKYASAKITQDRKNPTMNLLDGMLSAVVVANNDTRFHNETFNQNYKSAAGWENDLGSTSVKITRDANMPAHAKINADLMYKSVKTQNDVDLRSLHKQMITNDTKAPNIDQQTRMYKAANKKMPVGMDGKNTHIEVGGKMIKSANFKGAVKTKGGISDKSKMNPDKFGKKSTIENKRSHAKMMARKADIISGTGSRSDQLMSGGTEQKLRIAPLGNKRLRPVRESMDSSGTGMNNLGA